MRDGAHPARVIPIKSAIKSAIQSAARQVAPAKIYVRETEGPYASWRWACIWISQIIFYGLPWLSWGGRQIVLFDLAAGKFYVFGAVLWPQDGIYFAVFLIICACALFLSSAIGGRVWCGFGCPHTVYTEIFMWIERRIEGGRGARIRLDQAALAPGKLLKKAAKHGAWLILAAFTGFTFVGYFTPIRTLPGEMGAASPGWETLWMALYGSLMYYNAGWMREQFCKYICPHARFQSVMTDNDTLVIAYDAARGEPRGLRNRKQMARPLGDCVDCTLCVQVCPTGSDIRQGFHYDCMGCGACIDACNLVMDKIGAPRGLIRYTSENELRMTELARPLRRALLRPRILAYAALLLAAAAGLTLALALRIPLRLDVMLDRGVAREVQDGMIENVYRLQIMNADELAHRYKISVSGIDAVALASPDEVELGALASRAVPVRVRAPLQSGAAPSLAISFEIKELDGERRSIAERAVFPLQL